MEDFVVKTGVKRMMINGNPENVIEFNPSDVAFAEKFYNLAKEIKHTFEEGQKRESVIAKNKEVDEDGFPLNIRDEFAFTRELCEKMRAKVDELFGDGTIKKVFGESLFPEMFLNFLDAISPYLQSARSEKMEKYVPQARKRHVMK